MDPNDVKTLKLLEQLIAVQPDNWDARVHIAELYLKNGNPEKAEHVFASAKDLPDDEKIRLIYGRILSQTDQSKALTIFDEIIKKNKKCAPAYLELAMIYRLRGMKKDAHHYYSIATVINESLESKEFRSWLETDLCESQEIEDQEQEKPDELIDEEQTSQKSTTIEPASTSRPSINFSDIGGMDDVKERIRMGIIYPFKNPAIFERFKKSSGGGILLYGPPGCGKTHIARATAGECEANFISIGLVDILSKWFGESESNLHEKFEQARRLAPSVIFIDELDALGMSRQDARGSMLTTVINQMLIELDGINNDNNKVMILGATNAPWHVDSAFRRPGRFGKVIFIPPPDAKARKEIFNIHLRDLPAENIDLDKIIKNTNQFSGADIKAIIDLACEKTIYLEMKTGKKNSITTDIIYNAVKEIRPTTLEWLETAKNYASYSNRTGQYDDLVKYFQQK